MTGNTLEPRRRPTQARSARTFDLILETATLLLLEKGWDGFTTNALAERCGIGIQTLYRYFPNKLAVVTALSQQAMDEWNTWFDDIDEIAALGNWPALVQRTHARFSGRPALIAVRKAMKASPALRELDQKDSTLLARRFAEAITRHNPEITSDDATTMARVIIECCTSIFDMVQDMPRAGAQAHLKVVEGMVSSYLAVRLPK